MTASSGQIVYLGERLAAAGFTPRDRLEIDRWAGEGRRACVCQGETGPYAMLYEGAVPWASWGVMRQGARVLLWNCVNFADIGWFGSMHEALRSLRRGEDEPSIPPAEIIAFAPAFVPAHG